MSWVRQAIDDIKAQSYEELYPTGYGGSAKQPDIFWAVDPNDVPPPVRQAVETAVREQTLKSSLTCAIIRLETLGAYYSPTTARPDEPIGHFAIYLGTSPASTDLKTHLSTDLGNPPSAQAKPPPATASSKAKTPKHHSTVADGAEADEREGARTPSMGEIEGEYGRVEERSKNSGRRLSKLTATLDKLKRSK